MRPMDWGRQNKAQSQRKREKIITGLLKLFLIQHQMELKLKCLAIISYGIIRSNSMQNMIQRIHSGNKRMENDFQALFFQQFHFRDSSLDFFLQTGLPAEHRRMSLLNSFQNLSYTMFDFYADAGPETDGDNFVAKVQRRDIAMLGNFVRRLFTEYNLLKVKSLYLEKRSFF